MFDQFFHHFVRRDGQRTPRPGRQRRPNAPAAARTAYSALEPRDLLAGNVQAFIANDLLWIVGDNQSNQVVFGRSGEEVRVMGQHGTTVNGGSHFTLQTGSRQVTRDVFIMLQGGDDSINVQDGLRLTGSLTIFAGQGSDRVSLEDVHVFNNLSIVTGDGNNYVAMQDVRVGSRLWLEGGSGADTFYLNRLDVRGGTHLKSGDGADSLEIIDSLFAHFVSMEMNGGDDTAIVEGSQFSGGWHTSLGSGRDVLVLRGENQVTGEAAVGGQRGNDVVHVAAGGTVPTRLTLRGGPGNNATNVLPFTVGNIRRTVTGFGTASSDDSVNGLLADPSRGLADRQAAVRTLVSDAPPIPPMVLRAELLSGQTIESGGLQLTGRSSITISGTTRPGALVEVSQDGDNVFNDGQTQADEHGGFTIVVTGLAGSLEHGVNAIVVRATDDLNRQLTETFQVYRAVGTVVRFDSSLGAIDFELMDDAAPLTVANFLNYQERYIDSIVHRSAKSGSTDFVIQGGGFRLTSNTDLAVIATDPPVPSEASLSRSNVRGTLAMALQGGNPDSGTSQWFINMNDNAFLDAQSFTVFGNVIGNGMQVADQIHALNRFQLADLLEQAALTDVPLRNYVPFTGVIPGAVSSNVGSTTVTGIGTSFTTEIPADRLIRIGADTYFVATIVSDTELEFATPATITATNVSAFINRVPNRSQYIVMNTIAELQIPQ